MPGYSPASLFCALIDETIRSLWKGGRERCPTSGWTWGGAALGLLLALAAGVLWRKKGTPHKKTMFRAAPALQGLGGAAC